MRAIEPTIYHLAIAADWAAAQARGEAYAMSTLGVTLAHQGFVHCSFADQVQHIADLVYRDRSDVLLLTVDTGRLTSPIRVDQVGDRAFPHVYGPVDLVAVVGVRPLERGPDGRLETGLPPIP
jgi:uncharacterized protein (DUF952 family)